jgi:hypothetical protein
MLTSGSPPVPRRARRQFGRRRTGYLAALAIVVVVAAGCTGSPSTILPPLHNAAQNVSKAPETTTSLTTTTLAPQSTTVAPPTTQAAASGAGQSTLSSPAVTEGPIDSPPLPTPAAGFVADHVTIVGDSVTLDAQGAEETDIPGVTVEGAVSRQWYQGEELLRQLRAEDQLGGVVVVDLSTNGPITDTDFDNMMSVLVGAARVVFVTIHVDQPWQDPNNAVLAAGVARFPGTVLADFAAAAANNPQWFYSDGTHMPIGGPGAQALGALIAFNV